MTGERVIEALQLHDAQIVEAAAFDVPVERCQDAKHIRAQLGHVRWMIVEATGFVRAGKLEKAMRWLGFVQGALWTLNVTTIEEARRANMPPGETFQP